MATFSLTDDGTLDTVVRCNDCGEECRYNFDASAYPDDTTEKGMEENYDHFVEWACADAAGEHECSALDDFTRAYLDCALWSSTDMSDDSGGEPLDANYDIDDIATETLKEAKRECADFRDMAKDLLSKIDADDEQNGHDFWLTRNGHGAGFWDRGYGRVGDELSKIAKSFGSVDLVVDSDGKVRS